MRIAIIGSGISGCLAARLLSTQHDVTLYEANDYPGGHAHTQAIEAFGSRYLVDTAFMVFNRRTYPNFCRMLELLGVDSQPSDMSFSVRCSESGLEYQGSSLNGLFAQRTNLLRPSFLKMLRDITRFNQQATSAVASGELKDGRTVGKFLHQCGTGKEFTRHYLAPMAAAIWSAQPTAILEFPAEFMLGFFANHGLIQLTNRPQWRTIVNGSRSYVAALLDPLASNVRLNTPIESVTRTDNAVWVKPVGETAEVFDHVVFATHADQTLKILSDPSDREIDILSAFPYQPNEAVLHTDLKLMPRSQRAWASWNYHVSQDDNHCASVTYDLSRLQQLDSPTPLLLTLNETASIDPSKILRTYTYHHPAYSGKSIVAQQRRSEINGQNRTHYCGAYWGYGFHEDGVNSALAVAADFNLGLEACTAASTKASSATCAVGQ